MSAQANECVPDHDWIPEGHQSQSVTTRRNYRFGIGEESSIVWFDVPLCQACADAWDDHAAEGAAEAAAS